MYNEENDGIDELAPVLSSLSRNPSKAMQIIILCLCSPAALIAIFNSARASWHSRSPLGAFTSSTPINFARNVTPSPAKRRGSLTSALRSMVPKKTIIPNYTFY